MKPQAAGGRLYVVVEDAGYHSTLIIPPAHQNIFFTTIMTNDHDRLIQ
jgi:hypothetical protein